MRRVLPKSSLLLLAATTAGASLSAVALTATAAAQPARTGALGAIAISPTGPVVAFPGRAGPGLPTPVSEARPIRLSGALPVGLSGGQQCRAAIAAAQKGTAIPDHLLAAIGRVESGRRDPATGEWHPWPWTINAEGQGFFYETKAEAIAAVKTLQARGVRSIDVGCMQVNLMHHPDAFASLEDAFDPRINAAYAARFLSQLYAQTSAWPKAVAYYHSATPELGDDYQRRVMAIWPAEKQNQAAAQLATPAAAWAGGMPTSPGGRVAIVLPVNRAETIRVIPLSQQGATPPGRSLDGYRSMPIAIAAGPGARGG